MGDVRQNNMTPKEKAKLSTEQEAPPTAKPMLPTVRVQWSISATMECPYCEHDNDFTQVDEWWNFSKVGENVEKFHRPIETTCQECGKEFTVDGADY